MRHARYKIGSGASSRRHARRIAQAAKCAVETLETRVLLSVNVTSYHYDLAETGANTNETILTPSNVSDITFGKVASLPVDGQIYAQPLVMTGVTVGTNTEDLVFVATEHDSVYAFNAEGASTTPVWKVSLLQTGETTIPASATGTNDIVPEIGITGTPVINPATNTLYVEANFKESSGAYQQRLYAINIATGAIMDGGPVIISGTVNGTGAGSSGGKITFSSILENQRPALTLANGQVYVTFASHGDNGNYHGWIAAYNQNTLAQDYLWCNTPNGSQGGIWMSGGGLAVDSSGDLYLTSGNGSFDANSGGSDYAMAFVKLSPSLQVLDYFSPYNESSLSNADQDYGCGNAVLLPTQSGSAPDEAITLGKWGGVYLNNTDTGKMGEFTANGPNKDLGEANTNLEQHNTFAYWNGEVYIAPDGGKLRDYAIGNSTLSAAISSQSTHVFGTNGPDGQGAGVTVSSNGTSNGIVWALDNSGFNSNPAILYAYNASNLNQVLWTSNQYPGGRDTAGNAVKFTTPVVANGFVYVGGASSLTLFSNIPPAPPPPPPPPPVSSVTGFGNLTLNGGVPSVSSDGKTLTMTTQAGSEATSAYYNAAVTYQNFTAKFTYTESSGGPADGITFNLQNSGAGVNALGASGGSLGYSGITPSFAVELNIYQVSSTADTTNGATNQVHTVSNTGAVNLRSGDPINVTLAYNSEQYTLTETLTDANTNATYSTIYSDINLGNILGANPADNTNTAYMGFTGGTGGSNALQTITNFTYTTSANEPTAPTLPAGTGSVVNFSNQLLNAVSTDPAAVPSVSTDNNTLTITSAAGTEAAAAFNATPVDYGNFTANFTYTESGGSTSNPADGVAFILQDTPSLNQTGGQLGYGPSVPNSFAVEFNIYQVSSTSLGAGGSVNVPYNTSTNTAEPYGGNTGYVQLDSARNSGGVAGDPINVSLSYSSSSQYLIETLTDTVTQATSTTIYNNVNLTQILGGSPSAYVGFTGGTGGADALQTISGFSYSANTSVPVVHPGAQVNLTGYYTSYGIQNDGNPDIPTGNPNGGAFAVPGNGTSGYDGGGNQLSNDFFGASQTITNNGHTQTFDFGPVNNPGSPDTIAAEGQTINLPQGKYVDLSFLGSAANGSQQNQVFTVNYTDGTSQSFTQSLSDWYAPATTFPGESVAITMPYHLDATGAQAAQGTNQNIEIYQYDFALDRTKTAASISLPMNSNVKILAINVNAAPTVTSISPTSGPPAGGTTVTISGSGFTGATAVDFGSTPATSFTINNDGSISAVDPAGTGTVDVTVVGPWGTSPTTAADQFTYTSPSITVTNVVVNGDNPNGLYTAPGAANGKQRSMVEDIVYTFSAAVNIANANQAFTMGLAGTAGTLPSTLSAVPVAGSNGTQWAVILTGKAEGTLASIANGEYSITVNPQYVVSAADNTTPISSGRTDTFYRLFGDINGDEVVNAADNFQLKTAMTTYNPAFDANGDGSVNASDNFQFKADMGVSYVGFTPTI